MDPIFVIKKRILQGTTPKLTFQVLDDAVPAVGFQPDTLVMSIYDVTPSTSNVAPMPAVSSAIVNDREDVDVSAFCDASGNVEVVLEADDTELTSTQVERCTAKGIRRLVLFEWTWTSPERVGKGLFDLTIFPTYKPT